MLNGWASGAKPWKFPEVEPIIDDAIRLRRQLQLYLYTAFYRYHTEGIPPFRALVMDDPTLIGREKSGVLDDTANPYQLSEDGDIVDQFLIGDVLMAAPMMPGQTERDVVLPRGVWHDFYTGEEYEGTIRYACPLDKIPLFVKTGGIVPMLLANDTIEARCYGESGDGFIYDDDGETFAFESAHEEHEIIRLHFTHDDNDDTPWESRSFCNFASDYRRIVFRIMGRSVLHSS